MHYEITASQQAIRQNLTSAQRNSSLFSESPRIGGRTLRRGQTLKFDKAQFETNLVIIQRLIKAGAIQVVAVVEGKRYGWKTKEVESPVKEETGDAQGMVDEAVRLAKEIEDAKALEALKAAEALAAASTAGPTSEVSTEAKPLAEETVPQVAAEPVVEAPAAEATPEVAAPVESAPVEQGKSKKGKKA